MTVVHTIQPLFKSMFGAGDVPIRVRCWDGSEFGSPAAPVQLTFTSPRALRRMLWAPNELGFARAYVSGDILIEGDPVSYTHLRAHETGRKLVCRLLLE